MKICCESGGKLLRRWLKFNLVGAMGIGVQLAGVELASALLHASPALATAVGVEAAVLHNFVWHEKFTWVDRGSTKCRRARLAQFLWFNGTTGAISMAGNMALVLMVQWGAQVPVVAANCAAIAACSVINFVVNDQVVFRQRRFSSADFPAMLLDTENSTR
jgi:putative flippase GtrA